MRAADVQMVDLRRDDAAAIAEVRELMRRVFTWGTFEDAAKADSVIQASFRDEAVSRIARAGGRIIGLSFASLFPGESIFVHWLGVDPDVQRSGVGTALLDDAERIGRAAGAACLALSTGDDHPHRAVTTLGRRDIWSDPLGALRDVQTLERHPLDFYTRLGFTVCGVIPDANGPGKPEIYLARPIR